MSTKLKIYVIVASAAMAYFSAIAIQKTVNGSADLTSCIAILVIAACGFAALAITWRISSKRKV